jgi:hypothetical protein
MLAGQAEEMSVDQQRVRKTYTYKLVPTPEQEQALESVLWRCGVVANAPMRACKSAQPPGSSAACGVCVSCAMQSAHLPAIKAVRPEYREINAQVVQEVLHRLDKAFAACFRRVTAGARPGYPRVQGTDRSTSITYPQMGELGEHGGAVLDGGGWRDAEPIEDRAPPHSTPPSARRHPQDRLHQP